MQCLPKGTPSPCLIESKFQEMAERVFSQFQRFRGWWEGSFVISNDGMGLLTYHSLERSFKDNDFHKNSFGLAMIINDDTGSVRIL